MKLVDVEPAYFASKEAEKKVEEGREISAGADLPPTPSHAPPARKKGREPPIQERRPTPSGGASSTSKD